MSHTPGPWFAHSDVIRDSDNRYDGNAIAFAANYPSHSKTDWNDQLDNARLIAAAPELLEALERLSAQCTRLRLPGQAETDAEKTARAVIAKATGGAE